MTRENRRRLPNRRETLGALGAAGAAAWLGWRADDRPIAVVNAGSATCVQTPQDTDGPYWVEEMLNRSDLRIDPTDNSIRDGLPLTLSINVHQVSDTGCAALANAQVDLW